MFTGIVETIGTIEERGERGALMRLQIRAPEISRGVRLGDSVAINGACLTVTGIDGDRLSFEAVHETLERTSLGALGVGSRVNLERALRAGARLDGHIVQGNVDATGRVLRLERRADDVRLFVECGPEFGELLVEKGSVAIDGVSLTVVGARKSDFDVALTPHTLAETTLGERRPGDQVNLEADVLGKYVQRHVERILGERR